MKKFKFDFQNTDFSKMGVDNAEANDFVNKINETTGLNRDFPKLNLHEEVLVKQLIARRNNLVDEYRKIGTILEPLIDEEKVVYHELDDVSKQICKMQGHRLSMYPTGLIDYKNRKLELVGSARVCVICGELIYQDDQTENDVVVTSDERFPKRILYKKDK